MGLYGGGRPSAVFLPAWVYLGGEAIVGNAGNQPATIPAGATIAEIDAQGGDVYYALNGGAMSGFVPENGGRILGPLQNLNSIVFNFAVGGTAYIMYFRENTNRK